MEWRDIPGYEGFYQASDTGLVRSVAREIEAVSTAGKAYSYPVKERLLKQRLDPKGYPRVGLSSVGVPNVQVHQLVALAFLGPKPDGLQICHADDVKTNNAVDNLRYDTQSENQLDRVRNGTHHYASRSHCSRGHEYTDENTRVTKRGRICRACNRERKATRRVV